MCYNALVTARKCKEGNSKHLEITPGWTHWKHCKEMKTRLSLWWLVVTPELAVVIFFLFSPGKQEKFHHGFFEVATRDLPGSRYPCYGSFCVHPDIFSSREKRKISRKDTWCNICDRGVISIYLAF